MKAHTSSFKENIPKLGRDLDSKITYELNDETIELGSEKLNSITPHYEGAILKSVMKQLDIDSNVEIPVGTILTYEFGLKVNDEYEYINFGNYIVKSAEKQEDTRSWQITCYDKMLYAMKDYENSNITFPITIKDYLEAICEKVGLEYEGSSFANSDKVINNELYLDNEGRSLGYTFRDVLDEIAQVSGGTICINKDDKLEVRYIKDVGELTNVSGSSLTIETEEEIKLENFELEGKTTQATRSGKNLIYYTTGGSLANLTITQNTNGTLNISGTPNRSWANITPNITKDFVASQYTFSINQVVSINVGLRLYNDDSDYATFYINAGNTKSTITTTKSYTHYRVYFEALNQSTDYNITNFGFQLELGNQETSWELYGVQPSPDYPSELVSVGYQNLFDINNLAFATAYYSSTGSFVASYQNGIFDYIEVKPSTNYSLIINQAIYNTSISEFDENKVWLGRNNTSNTSINTIKSKSNTKYIRISFNYNNSITMTKQIIKDCQPILIEGTQTHSYIPYGKYGVEVKTNGKNLFGNLFNGYYDTNGNFVYSNSRWCTQKLKKGNNTNLYFYKSTPSSYAFGLVQFDINNNLIKREVGIGNEGRTFEQNTDTFAVFFYDVTSIDGIDIEISFEEITTHEPYQSNTQVYQLDNPLRSIGDIKDLLYIKNGMLYVDRKIGNVVLNGSETWYRSSDDGGYPRYYTVISNAYFHNDNLRHSDKIKSNYFIATTTASPQSIYQYRDQMLFDTPTILNTLELFKNWLSTHNTEVQYILAEPYTEELGEVNIPSTYKGITHLNTTDELEPNMNITYVSEVETIDEEYLKDVNVNFGEKFGKVNTIVLSRGGDGDKTALSNPTDLADEDKVAIQITDNQIMNGNNRDEFMPAILNKLYGLEYYINDFSSTGICYLDLCDRYNIKIGDNTYKCIMFNDEVNITQGLQENIYTDMQEEIEQEYKYIGSTDRGITQANIIANKVEATITEYTQRLDEANNRLNAVETKQTDTDRTINILSTNIDNDGNVTEVTTTTGFTFNADGMTIADNQTNFKALHRNTGTYYYDGDTITGQYTKDGSKQKDLELFGVYYYGKEDIDDTPMFVAQLYTDKNGEECFGHFYNRSDN